MCSRCQNWTAYCEQCWEDWTWTNEYFLNQVLRVPERYRGRAIRDYERGTVHVLPIGLGTFGTILEKDTYWMHRLLEASSKRKH